MAQKRINILIIEPSLIIRKGLISIILDNINVGVNISELTDFMTIKDHVVDLKPDIVVLNPTYLGIVKPVDLLDSGMKTKFIALQNQMVYNEQLQFYDGSFSITSSENEINLIINKLANIPDKDEEGLSLREKEIVIAIALGKTNKEIADQLCLSTHTVMTHRKNIASKLKIHNPAGLTIYAIVNKLIDVNDVNIQ